MEQALDQTRTLCDSSFSSRRWLLKQANDGDCQRLMQRFGVPEITARLLCLRGVAEEAVEAFLTPTLKQLLPDPNELIDMPLAAERLASAIVSGETIAVFGDYDVDGATASALLMRYLRSLGAKAIVYIPDRMKEGYGPNAAALLKLKEQGATLVITVDCGTLAFEPLEEAFRAGLDVLVVDHHQGEARLPACYALVNPNRLDETSPHRYLAAVGVAFLLLVATHRLLKADGFFATRTEPNLLELLDLVALGTVCDVVPLVGVNRAFVAQGLKVMAMRGNLGLRTLMDVARAERAPDVFQLGFMLGPRINAGGRVGNADFGTKLLTTEDEAEALQLAQALDRFNAERRALEEVMLEEAVAQAEALIAAGEDKLLLVYASHWHQGVIGIIAGRLKERYHLPTAAIAFDENGIGKASARSIHGFDFGAAVISAVAEKILEGGGGHSMAAGFSVKQENLMALRAYLSERITRVSNAMQTRCLHADACVSLSGATLELAQSLAKLAPYGTGNASPLLVLERVKIVHAKPVGTSHLRLMLTGDDDTGKLPAIAFRCVGTPLGEALSQHLYKPVSLLGELQVDSWQGRENVSFRIIDAAVYNN